MCFKRLRKQRLGGSKETDMGHGARGYASNGLAGDPRVMESSMLKSVIIQVEKVTCESMLEFIPMQIEDSKSLAQSGHAQRMKMLMPSRY